MINEALIHFIWQHQAFDHKELRTTDGQLLQVVKPGNHNSHAGPDFSEARILLDGLEWQGSVEIHVDGSDWYAHHHDRDPAYNNVILHAIWRKDILVKREDNTSIPSLILQERVSDSLVLQYFRTQSPMEVIPCASHHHLLSPQSYRQALDIQFQKRIASKTERIYSLWHKNNFDWEQTAFAWLCRYMGFHTNGPVFEILGTTTPYRILMRHRDRPEQVEALLFGMAGMLEQGFEKDAYWYSLKKEFRFLKHKYRLKPRIKFFEWKFLRMRPANFPTVRIAQLAGLIVKSDSLLNWMIHEFDFHSEFLVSDYWKLHYSFGRRVKEKPSLMGQRTRKQLWMNVVPPLAIALNSNQGKRESDLLEIYSNLPAENNAISRLWQSLDVTMESALDSQSYHALYTQSCKMRKCLECPVGIELLRSA